MSTARKTFSIIIPVYYNEENLPYTIPRLQKIQELLPEYSLEFVFVDDGSQDSSLQVLLNAKKQDNRIKVVKLSRNFGSMSAIQAGMKYACGDCVGIISADLQDPPELFLDMIRAWEQGKKIVMAVREDRDEPLSQKMFSNTYYFLMDKYALEGYPPGGFDFVLMDKQVVADINRIEEKNTNIMSLIFWLGYERDQISYVRAKREHGKSKWTLKKKIKLFVDSFVSFSFAPIQFISVMGFFVAFLSFTYGIFVLISYLCGFIPVAGWASLVALITFLLGMIMLMLGVIGEYLWRILDETRKRPTYLIDEIYE